MSNSRLEKFIYAICSMEVSDLPAPLSRIEILWNCLITGETPDFEPQSRNEQYLMAMLGLYELENLPTPLSRGEKLLYKIAMGETDLSDIPAYLSRYEELLGYLAENGGVGDFEYILQTLNQRLSTLYSTKERPMKQAVIKGDTLVNELPRPSLKNTMANVASQKLNQGYDNGKTLVNLASKKTTTLTPSSNNIISNDSIKSRTIYTIAINVHTLNEGSRIRIRNVLQDGTNSGSIRDVYIILGKNIFTVETVDNAKNLMINYHNSFGTSEVIIDDIVILEGNHTNQDIPYFEGTKTFSTTPNVVDGEFKQAVVKGQTLVNIKGEETNSATGSTTYPNHDFLIPLVKKNTDYLIKYDATVSKELLAIGFLKDSGNWSNNLENQPNVGLIKLNSGNYPNYFRIIGKAGVSLTINNLMIIEYQEGMENWDIPYFEGMQSVQLSEVTTTGKNLYKSAVSIWNNNQYIISGTSKDVPCDTVIDPSTEYVLSWNGNNRNGKVIFFNNGVQTRSIDINWWASSIVFTTNKDENGFSYYIRLEEDPDEITYTNFNVQLEKGSVATPYEPYQSNTLTLTEPVNLRKVGDVEDEFDALTGKVTERVGEVVLDGSDDELWSVDTARPNHYKFLIPLTNSYYEDRAIITSSVISDKYPSINNGSTDAGGSDVESICINGWVVDGRGKFNLSISKTKLSDGSVETLKTYLQQNPFTVQYQLETETTKQVNTTITNQDGATQTKLHSFNDGYLSVSSQGLLPSAVNYEVPTNNSYYLPDMLTLGAQYTSRGSADCNATIDGKLLTLGKNRTFTTPSSVTNRLMVLDAPVDDLMFIKGDQTAKDFGYFEGMKSVEFSNKMPVLTTTWKNLFDIKQTTKQYMKDYTEYGHNGFSFSINYHDWAGVKFCGLNPSKTYTLSYKKETTATTGEHSAINVSKYRDGIWAFLSRSNENSYSITFTDADAIELQGASVNDVINLVKIYDIQLEEGSVATPYEPFKSNILTVNEDVALRGNVYVNGELKEDTLDLVSGEHSISVGEAVLNGSENWSVWYHTDTLLRFSFNYPNMSNLTNIKLQCDNFPSYGYNLDAEGVFGNSGKICLIIDNSNNKLLGNTVNDLKTYLSKNPITVQYPLEEKSIKTVDLTTVDQDGQPTKLKTFNDITHVEINSDSIIPTVELEVATKMNETLSTLGLEHHDISETQNELSQTIVEQTENTDAAMLATTEIYENL